MKKSLFGVILILLCAGLFGCAKTKATDVFRFEVRELEININEEKELKLIRGDIDDDTTIVYTMYCLNGDKYEEIYDNGIVQCNGSLSTNYENDSTKGLKDIVKVKGLKVGSVRFTAYLKSSPNITDSIIITVNKDILTAMEIVTEKNVVWVEEQLQLAIKTYPESISKEATYSVDKNDVATIDNNGKLIGVKPGEVVVTATSKYDTSLSVQKKFIVTYAQASEITVNKETVDLKSGENFDLIATVTTPYAEKKVTYTSSDTKVCTIDANGHIEALKEGTSNITVKSSDGNATKTVVCNVTYLEATGIEVTNIEALSTMDLKTKKTVTAKVSPDNANQDFKVEIIIGDSIVLNNKEVSANMIGTTKIKVSTLDGKFSKEVTIDVKYAELKAVTAEINKTDITIDEELEMKVTISPAGANPNLTYTSTNNEILTVTIVEDKVIVKGIKAGTAKVQIKDTNDDIKKEVEFTVYEKPTAINVTSSVTSDSINIDTVSELQLTVVITPNTAFQAGFTVVINEDIAEYEIDETNPNQINIELYDVGSLTIKIVSDVNPEIKWEKTYTITQ